MKVGITLPNLGIQATRDNILQTATQAEKEGFDSVWHIPYANRGERADEFIQVMKKIWTDDVVEFKGKYYNIPASKIDPKPIQKPSIPIYLGGFTPNTFSRITKYDLNGWLGVVVGPLEYIENSIKSIKGQASQVNKNPER